MTPAEKNPHKKKAAFFWAFFLKKRLHPVHSDITAVAHVIFTGAQAIATTRTFWRTLFKDPAPQVVALLCALFCWKGPSQENL
ncbi:hypothetical protein EV663_1024 [Rhodovulum bhavnagarense]|uniref:Uncharacterized protein n=1 Tax=Rhodovulum bhavnagarense TaxID=992286 RepID=A0A4R2RF29_9RHOB|nr:hypothetical protein [Rhodovulum bhavnagarense]TCP62162.1 hypothetical protein EV663_1024 [Rhodovulum bhavnagarense]